MYPYKKAENKHQIPKSKNGDLRHTFIVITIVLCIVGSILFIITPRLVLAQGINYEITGEAQPIDTVYNLIYGVEVNDQVLISISPSEDTGEWYDSYVYYPNQTQIANTYASGSHSYHFTAEISGDYILSFKTGSGFDAGAGFNSTIKSSHPLTPDGTQSPETEEPEQPTEPETPDLEPSETPEVLIDLSEPIREAPPVPLPAPEAVAVTTAATVAVGGLTLTQLFQKFVNTYAGKSWEEVSQKEIKKLKSEPRVTKIEIGHIAISIVIMTLIFGIVEANGLQGLMDLSSFLIVLPSALLSTFFSSSIIELWTIGSEIICGKLSDVYRRFRLWRFGLGTFVLSGLLFSFAFSSPGITKFKTDKKSDVQTRKIKGLLVLSKALLVLTLAALFAGIILFLDMPVIGDSGLLIILMTVCYSLVPVEPLPGRQLYEYNKWISIVSLTVLSFFLYSNAFYLLPAEIFFTIGLASIPFALITLYTMKKISQTI